jgi:hypothetical protein
VWGSFEIEVVSAQLYLHLIGIVFRLLLGTKLKTKDKKRERKINERSEISKI